MSDEKNMVEEEIDMMTLEFDDGTVEECEILGVFDFEGASYIALLPADPEDPEDESVYLYSYKEDGDDYELGDIEDDALFDKVAAEFERIMGEEEE